VLINPDPLTVNEKGAPPCAAPDGERLEMIGTGLTTVKLTALDVPPPGVGVKTVIANVPRLAVSAAVIIAVSCVLLTNVVTRLLPANLTTELPAKFEPFTVRVKSPRPAPLLVGLIVLNVGVGLLTLRLMLPDVPPPGAGLKTEIG
jgi:hypothetical protein